MFKLNEVLLTNFESAMKNFMTNVFLKENDSLFHGPVGVVDKPVSKTSLNCEACFTNSLRRRKVAVTLWSS